jgi:hypothetical protein
VTGLLLTPGSPAASAAKLTPAQKAAEQAERAAATAAAQRAARAQIPRACSQADVRITTTFGSPSAAHFSQLVFVRNIGTASCTLPQFPLVAIHAASPQDDFFVGPEPSTPAAAPVVLEPGETASSVLYGVAIPVGSATNCATYPSFTVNVAVGTPAAFDVPLPDCAARAITVWPFAAGFDGVPPASGRVEGFVPKCANTNHGPGPMVALDFSRGKKVIDPDFTFASPTVTQPFSFDLAPGTYVLRSGHERPKSLTVRAGWITTIGTFGVCNSVPVVVHGGGSYLTTTTSTS